VPTYQRGTMKRLEIACAILICAALLFLSRAHLSRQQPTGAAPPLASPPKNIVLIVIDTLRADHLQTYGYARDTAPFLEEISSRGVVFEKVFSTSSWIAPATASLFTALYPSQHGVITGHNATRKLRKKFSHIVLNRIPDQLETLPELLGKAGYSTFGISDNFKVFRKMGFGDGFERLDSAWYRGGDEVNAIATRWKEDLLVADRYFLYLHYVDPHQPYHKREPWFEAAQGQPASTIARYDSEISYVDGMIRKLFDEFQWQDDTLLIVTSDHGEGFLDHGNWGHDKTLFTEVLHIPLIVYHPSLKPARLKGHASILNIYPTLRELLGGSGENDLEGVSLLPAPRGVHALPGSRALFAELIKRKEETNRSVRSVLEGKWNFIEQSRQDSQVAGFLFDLKADSREQRNHGALFPQIVASLRKKNRTGPRDTLAVGPEAITLPIDEEKLKRLRSLGYV